MGRIEAVCDAREASELLENGTKERADDPIVGNREAIQALWELIVRPFKYDLQDKKLDLKRPRGLLIYGPPGTGKTKLVEAVVRKSGAHLTKICTSVHGEHGAEILRESFSQANSHSLSGKPSVIFIDKIDVICPHCDDRKEHESRIVGILLKLIDETITSKFFTRVVLIAATNRVDAIDPALRRPGRFYNEIEVSVPTAEERLKILELYSRHVKIDHKVDLQTIAQSCIGYVGIDLEALCCEAIGFAKSRLSNAGTNGDTVTLMMEDFKIAKSEVSPSITRGFSKEFSMVSWDEIGGLKDLKKKIKQAVEWPIKYPHAFAQLRISPVRGVLLHGPPGCSKTILAKAVAHSCQASFFSLSAAELYTKYVGEGEALLRQTFRIASLAAPSILFFDEADAIAPKRGDQGENSNSDSTVGLRLLSTLLTEMDGLESATGIIVLAATNRPHAIDGALLRPGRFDKVFYVPPPDFEGRYEILLIHTRKMKLAADVDLRQIARRTNLFTGADLRGLCNEAGMIAMREDITALILVYARHFETAMKFLRPSLTAEMLEEYSKVKVPSRG